MLKTCETCKGEKIIQDKSNENPFILVDSCPACLGYGFSLTEAEYKFCRFLRDVFRVSKKPFPFTDDQEKLAFGLLEKSKSLTLNQTA
jgi:hypothetical protein